MTKILAIRSISAIFAMNSTNQRILCADDGIQTDLLVCHDILILKRYARRTDRNLRNF